MILLTNSILKTYWQTCVVLSN